ncbi:hypothetical protein [Leptospira sp. GIMC2001]|uniref:hypothetical protein n=1 Tax=Leptospira sp. GIMC2001 TaxID=1513297 RepID=UPI00234A3352|nr:hypothetical protein [Leptospira sp. GIMC2001]WCL49951.1 hypothetical protein O4O04_03785 [Leptospira sp. GIMC2001]
MIILQFKRIILLLVFSVFLNQCELLIPQEDNSDRDAQNLLLFLALTSGCDIGNSGFWTIDFTTGEDQCVRVRKVAEGNSVILFEEVGLDEIRAELGILINPSYSGILSQIEARFPLLKDAIGNPSDINGDGKVAIVFLNISTFFTGGSFVAGYFNPLDLFSAPAFSGINTNQREVIFVDAIYLTALGNNTQGASIPRDLMSTVFHELQHLIRYPWEVGKGNATAPLQFPRTQSELNTLLDTDSLWINEGTSELASDIAGYGPQESRLACLRADPAYGCQNLLNGKSLYRFTNRIIDYSLSYAWMANLYHNAGNTLAERNQFLKATIQGGTFNRRGKNIFDLTSLFRTNAPRFNSTILSSNSTTVHGNITGSFFANFFKYPNAATTTSRLNLTASSTNISSVGGGTGLLTTYALPSTLDALVKQPGNVSLINNSPTNFDLNPGQIYRVAGTAPALSFTSNIHVFQNGLGGSEEYVIFNGNLNETNSSSTFVSSVKASGSNMIDQMDLHRKPNLNLPIISGRAGIHAAEYIQRRNAWKILQTME